MADPLFWHRLHLSFPITFHRQVRAKGAITSALDTIPGIGPKRKKALLKKFGKSDAYPTSSRKSTFGVEADFADNRPIVGTELGQRLGQSKGSHTRPDRA